MPVDMSKVKEKAEKAKALAEAKKLAAGPKPLPFSPAGAITQLNAKSKLDLPEDQSHMSKRAGSTGMSS